LQPLPSAATRKLKYLGGMGGKLLFLVKWLYL